MDDIARMKITIGFTTSRHNPKFEWFWDSFEDQLRVGEDYEVIRIDLQHGPATSVLRLDDRTVSAPKPTVWQGMHRLTRNDWWAVSNARNTVTALARGSYVVWVDDRCVLGKGWLKGIREAAAGNYAVSGAYEKRKNMEVVSGKIMKDGELMSRDDRLSSRSNLKICRAPGSWFFGGTLGMPLEWAFKINGFEERLDSASAEDTMCGLHLENNGLRIAYDPRVFITEDRTPSECGPDMRRTSKERHPNDKTDKLHTVLRTIARENRANPDFDLRELHEYMKTHDGFPHHGGMPHNDWFDGQEIGPEFDDCYEGLKEWPKR
jgi:hypothetical protein